MSSAAGVSTPRPDLQPVLIGDRVSIRPIVEADRDEMAAVAADPLIWAQHPAHDRWRPEVFARFFDDALASGGGLTLVDRSTGTIIGASRYARFNPDQRSIEIGWTFLARDHWGDGTNREVKALMIAYAFTFADVVVFEIGAANLRSRRAVEKIGGVRRPAMQTRTLDGGAVVSHVVYEIMRPT